MPTDFQIPVPASRLEARNGTESPTQAHRPRQSGTKTSLVEGEFRVSASTQKGLPREGQDEPDEEIQVIGYSPPKHLSRLLGAKTPYLPNASFVPSSSGASSLPVVNSKKQKMVLPKVDVIDITSDDELDDRQRQRHAGPSNLNKTPSTAPDDFQLALKLQQELQEEDRRQREEDNKKSAEYIAWLDKTQKDMDEKRAKLARAHNGKESGLVYQVVIDAEGRTLEGDDDADNQARLEVVRRDFEANLQSGMKIKKVHWFVNQKLEVRFEMAKARLESLGIDVTERNLFHGTAEKNIQPILEDGFQIGGISKGFKAVNGTACGYGIYLATDSMTSSCYTAGSSKMFMCRVITGRTTPHATRGKPPKILGAGPFEAYEQGGVVVLKHVELCVPRYVVEFLQPGYQMPFIQMPPLAGYMTNPQAYNTIPPPIPAPYFNGITIQPLRGPRPTFLQPQAGAQIAALPTRQPNANMTRKRKREDESDLSPQKRRNTSSSSRSESLSKKARGKRKARVQEVVELSD